jgi:hypothetical protein
MVGGLFSGTWSGTPEPGYGISTADVPDIQQQLCGIPITVNHNGLYDAIRQVDAAGETLTAATFSRALGTGSALKSRAVGRVLDTGAGTDVVFTLGDNFSGLQKLVRAGLFNHLSLTHVDNGGKKEPLELSLTVDPARTGANIVKEYKPVDLRILNTRPTMSAEVAATDTAAPMETVTETPKEIPAAEPAAESTPMEAVLKTLPADLQEVLIKRLGEYQSSNEDLRKQAEENKTAAENAAKMLGEREADGALVKDQIAYLQTLLHQSDNSIEAQRIADVGGYLDKNTLGHTQMALERVVTACSRALANGTSGGARPQKRRAVESAGSKPAGAGAPAGAAAAAPAAPALDSSVRNLLRSQFDAF